MITNENINAINSINEEIKRLKTDLGNLMASKKQLEAQIIENFPTNEKTLILGTHKVSLKYTKKRTIDEEYLQKYYPQFYQDVVSFKVNLKSFDEEISKEENINVLQDENVVNVEKIPSSLKIEEVTDEDL